jgi:hypothetical protein
MNPVGNQGFGKPDNRSMGTVPTGRIPPCKNVRHMARTTEKKPTIADLLDQAAEGGTDLKLDKYLATLDPDVKDRVVFYLRAKKPDGSWAMASRKIALTISEDPSTSFTISASAVDTWRGQYVSDDAS